MWPYWVLFLIPACLAVSRLKPNTNHLNLIKQNRWPDSWRLMFIYLVLMIGLRHETGGDWPQYMEMIKSYRDNTSQDNYGFQDPAFVLLNRLSAWSGMDLYFLNLFSAVIFSWGLVVFCRAQTYPWLTLLVSVPYLITVVAIGYTRQGVAIGIAMVAMVALSNGNTIRFIFWIGIAALFHKSAILLIPMAILASSKRRFLTALWVVVAGLTLFILLLQEATSILFDGYIEAGYQSSGANIRIAMNAFPALLFLVFAKRFKISNEERTFWKWMSWGALTFVPLLIVSPSSTAVDRVALYWIPLQLYILPRLPAALGKIDGKNPVLVYSVVAYSAFVHFVWLFYADTSSAWIPYQFYPWVWLWQ